MKTRFRIAFMLVLLAELPVFMPFLLGQQSTALQWSNGPTSLMLRASNDVALYYLVERSTDLRVFHPWSLQLGLGGPSWEVSYPAGSSASFFRSFWYSLYGPGDLDHDGLDDVWELDHPGNLNPLNPVDAGLTNPITGFTYLQDYVQSYGRRVALNEVIAREVSLHNFGVDLPGNHFAALSYEVSLYNHGVGLPGVRYEAISSEVSFYNGEHAPHPLFGDAVSHEVSLYNSGVNLPIVRFEAISREVSLYLGERAPSLHQHESISQEVSLYNSGIDQPGNRYEAMSREISLYNNLQ